MVWGMIQPTGFGEYWPEGEFVGWFDDLRDYHSNRMSDEDKVAMGMEKHFDLTAIVNKFSEDLGPVKPEECPTVFTVDFKKNKGDYASLIALNSRVLAVDETLKGIIETLEPDTHQFWRIRLQRRTGREYPQTFYGIRIGKFLDSFSPEQSAEGSWREKSGFYGPYFPYKRCYVGLALSQEVIGSTHLWCEKRLLDPRLFLSDTLMAEIDKAGFRVPKHFRLLSV